MITRGGFLKSLMVLVMGRYWERTPAPSDDVVMDGDFDTSTDWEVGSNWTDRGAPSVSFTTDRNSGIDLTPSR